jgi:opacity protein-like surface antigen
LKRILFVLLLLPIVIYSQPEESIISTMPGAFSRMGFGARGIGMGNAFSAVTEGNLSAYYNPALSAFQNGNFFQASYTFLSLDRTLNFLSYTRKFDFVSQRDSSESAAGAGVTLGLINSGVSNIDGRDDNGVKTGELSTSENLFFVGVADRISEKLSIGILAKFYYYSLYQGITSSAFGIDIGGLYKINDHFNVSLVFTDLNTKYKWDSSPVFQEEGTITEDKFPLLKKIGVSYYNKSIGLLTDVELESSDAQTNILRAGMEYNIYDNLFIRGGIDQFNLSNGDFPVKPSLGFSYLYKLDGVKIGVEYAYMVEEYSPSSRNVIGLNFIF